MSYYQRPQYQYRARPLASASAAPRQIVAKYASVCSNCKGAIAVGEAVLWAPGSPAVHVECPVVVATVAPAAPVARLEIEDAGIYVLPDGAVVKVQANREKTRVYAKRWVASHQDRLMADGEHAHGEYVFESGLVAQVQREGRKMTLEEAKAHSIRYGRCVRCGRQLVDGKSVEQGMGPVCVTYFQAGS